MSAFTIGQQVSCNGVDLRIRSLEGNVLCLEASDGSFFGFRHVSSVKPIECTPAADAALSPAGLVARSLSVPECTVDFLASLGVPLADVEQVRYFRRCIDIRRRMRRPDAVRSWNVLCVSEARYLLTGSY